MHGFKKMFSDIKCILYFENSRKLQNFFWIYNLFMTFRNGRKEETKKGEKTKKLKREIKEIRRTQRKKIRINELNREENLNKTNAPEK